ncbi:MAG: phosphodiester glycosidase family protein [Oscillospiraceae bacterium]|nr:phosphodiester glycosidase family protein [Oscillospiraceae bacterium]
MFSSRSREPGRAPGPLTRVLSFLGVTLLCLVLILLALVWVLEKGPSPTVTGAFCRSVRETSAIRWVSRIFLSEEELEQYIGAAADEGPAAAVNTSLIHLAALPSGDGGGLELLDIAEGTCKGKLLIVHDPKRVILGTSDAFGTSPGLQLTDMAAKYHAAAAINAGGFEDEGGRGNGSRPTGLVIRDGELAWGTPAQRYHVVGLDGDGILHVGAMTGREALERGLRWAVSFETHDGLASALIVNGEIQQQNLGGGINPRTAIGQREDGALLLLVLDGRSIGTLGATMEDVCSIMLEYGAVNAGNLDGGSSSSMVYGGEVVNNSSSIVGPRKLPTAFIVLEGGEADG